MDNIKEQSMKAIKEAGKIISQNIRFEKRIETKSYANYVTHIDLKVQDFLINKLREIIPDSNIICEETYQNVYKFDKLTWVLDPVDGTTNLIHRHPHISISLSLLEKRKPILGIVYNPVAKELFTAVVNEGAYLNNRPINVSQNETLDKCIIGFGLPYNRDKAHDMFEYTEYIFNKCQDIRRSGSAALDLSYVACGRLDGYFEFDLKPWDFSAGLIILQEAGGKITKWDGEKINTLKSNNVLATNKHIHEELKHYLNLKSSKSEIAVAAFDIYAPKVAVKKRKTK